MFRPGVYGVCLMEAVVLVRAHHKSTATENAVQEYSLSGVIVHACAEGMFIVTAAAPLRPIFSDEVEIDRTTERTINTVKLGVSAHIDVRINAGNGIWMVVRSVMLVRHPKESARVRSMVKPSEWDICDLDYFCDLLLLRCDPHEHASALALAMEVQDVRPGAPVLVAACPFGIFCPDAFAGALSSGVVAATVSDSHLFLTDARGLPGAAGGAVVPRADAPRAFAMVLGLVLGDLRRASGQHVEVNICLAWAFVLDAVAMCLRAEPVCCTPQPRQAAAPGGVTAMTRAVEAAGCSVVLIAAGSMWASGVILDR
jgi:hypothetical protein